MSALGTYLRDKLLAEGLFCIFMDRDIAEVHKSAEKGTRLTSSHLGRTSLVRFRNRQWFSIVFTLIDKDIRNPSGQNVVDSRGAAEFLSNFRLGRKSVLVTTPRNGEK